jgi:hypothetical protein
VCLFLGRELLSTGFFLCAFSGVASLVEKLAKIFHSHGVECAWGFLSKLIVVSSRVDVALCRCLQSYPGRVVSLLDVLWCS